MRRLILAALAAAVAGGAVAVPSRVQAHALPVSSTPAAGATLRQPPASVTITFGEEPDPLLSRIEVLGRSGRQFQKGSTKTVRGDPRRLVVALGVLPAGVYTVAWTTVSAVDGHVAAGVFAFGVAVSPAAVHALGARPPPAALGAGAGPSAAAVAGRWCLYAGLVLLLGAAVVGSAVFVTPPRSSLALLPAAWALAAVGTAVTVGVQASEAGVGPGQLLHTALARGAEERAATVGLGGALVLVALRTRGSQRRSAVALSGAGAAAAMLADVTGSHAAAGTLVAANSALQWVHVVAAGVWLGGLAALLPALRGEPGELSAEAVRRFSAAAGIALAALAVTGTARAAVEIGDWHRVMGTAYGRLVVVKAALLGVLAAVGAINRVRNVPRAARTTCGLRRAGWTEVGVATAALLAAATLVNVAPPAQTIVAGGRPPSPAVAAGGAGSVAELREPRPAPGRWPRSSPAGACSAAGPCSSGSAARSRP